MLYFMTYLLMSVKRSIMYKNRENDHIYFFGVTIHFWHNYTKRVKPNFVWNRYSLAKMYRLHIRDIIPSQI